MRENERLARLANQAVNCLRVHVERRRDRYAAAAGRLAAGLRHNAQAQAVRIERARERIVSLLERAERAVNTLIDHRAARVERAGQLLAALSYHGVLARGFALVRDLTGRPLTSATALAPGLRIDVEFAEKTAITLATADGGTRRPAEPKPRARGRRGDGGEGQGGLWGVSETYRISHSGTRLSASSRAAGLVPTWALPDPLAL